MELKQLIENKAEELFTEVLKIRRHLHRHPELSFEEAKTSAYIRGLLDDWDISYQYPFAEHGILATIEGSNPDGKVIALRADMDALPIKENSGLEFESCSEGVMHACGHDIHMASLLGTAKIINHLKDHFTGKVLLIFQPGEEKLPGGAKLMMAEGLFSKIQPDMIIAQHVLPEMETGSVGFKPGEYMASSDEIFITVNGKGGHAALPENINDPILMASHILIALQQEINRKAPKGTPTVLSFGKVVANGAVNVIPDQVNLEGTFRTMNEEWRKKAHSLILQIASGIAQGMGGSVDINIKNGYPVLKNNEEITSLAKSFAIEMLGKEKVIDMNIRMTAEDFAWFSHAYPSMLYRLGVKNASQKEVFALHTSQFMADEDALKTGISLLPYMTLRFLNDK